ncbi:hypothetical protein, partial [Paraeggerthella sp.]|uniref:hypothetical protein n=1 Tax=Paraeggerthella sp. TaxID=2897350 RepID=UPI003AB3F081
RPCTNPHSNSGAIRYRKMILSPETDGIEPKTVRFGRQYLEMPRYGSAVRDSPRHLVRPLRANVQWQCFLLLFDISNKKHWY